MGVRSQLGKGPPTGKPTKASGAAA